MTLDGFLTFLTIILAAYAIMPSVPRLRIGLRINWLIFISIVSFAIVMFLEFTPLFSKHCPVEQSRFCEALGHFSDGRPINKGQAAFLVVIAWLLLASFAIARRKLTAKSLPALSRLVSELVYQQKHAELVDLLDSQLSFINAAANRLFWQAKLFDRVAKLDPDNLSDLWERIEQGESDNDDWKGKIGSRLRYFLSFSKIILPSGNRKQEAAVDIFRVIFQSHALIEFIAVHRPKFGIQVLSCQSFGMDDFCEAFFVSLLANRSSSLYGEIRQNENQSRCGYVLEKHNQLLFFLFQDSNVAKRLSVWKPIGDYIISNLGSNKDPKYIEFLNGPADSFYDQDRWRDPTFIAIRFFDIMVASAVCQGIEWHMWLYYFPPILEELVKNYDETGSEVDPNSEWPTRGSHLIYAMFVALRDWVDTVEGGELPDTSPHLIFGSVAATHENNNIPKSAALALGHCLEILITAENVSEKFQVYIYDIVMRQIRQFQRDGVQGQMRQILVNTIIARGALGIEPQYGAQLKSLLGEVDHLLRYELDDYVAALNQAYP
jgi:hypothetical protein